MVYMFGAWLLAWLTMAGLLALAVRHHMNGGL